MRKFRIAMWLMTVFMLIWTGANASSASGQDGASTLWARGWPMIGHDAQRTNRSEAIGPTVPRLISTVSGGFDYPLVGPENAVYALGGDGLHAFNGDLKQQWTYVTGNYVDPYVLLPNGDLVLTGFSTKKTPASTDDSVVVSIRDGAVQWRIQPFDLIKGGAPVASANGRTYLPIGGPQDDPYVGLIVLSASGHILLRLPRRNGGFAIAVSASGNLYENDGTLRAFNAHGRLQWARHPVPSPIGTGEVMIGAGGIVYATFSNNLYSYTRGGILRWKYAKSDGISTMAERADGAIVLAGPRSLQTVSRAGKRMWRRSLGIPAGWFRQSTLSVDARGTAYVGTQGGLLRVFSSSGALLARLAVGPAGDVAAPHTALRPDGHLVVAATGGSLRVYGQ